MGLIVRFALLPPPSPPKKDKHQTMLIITLVPNPLRVKNPPKKIQICSRFLQKRGSLFEVE